jgi:hypothetical protein
MMYTRVCIHWVYYTRTLRCHRFQCRPPLPFLQHQGDSIIMSTAQGGSTFFLVPHSPPWVVTLAPSAKKKHHSAGGQITKMDIPSFVFDQFDDRHPFARADPPVPFSGQTTQVTGHGRVDGGTGVNGQGASSIIIGALGYVVVKWIRTSDWSDWQGHHGVPQSSAENGYAPVTGKGTTESRRVPAEKAAAAMRWCLA